MTLDVTDEVQRPGARIPLSVTLAAADRTPMPASGAAVELPEGWSADPGSVRLRPSRPGRSATADFVVTIPENASDGTHTIRGVVSTDEWELRAPVRITVLRNGVALGKPATP
ncbi:NEW3 domain-containing protein [Streptomyces sp. B8F3]|uniref:NEW3 domain-containing protein n=1 Tax=Streptomyces sp. B8F3 TaxID=3153573 RepID=UPI00325D0ECF